jgi:hypothetical protein
MTWMKLDKGTKFSSFEFPLTLAGYAIHGQQQLDDIIAIGDAMRESGASDLEIAQAVVAYLKRSIN